MYVKRKEIARVVEELLKHSQPQKGKFIGAFSLCKDYKDWKEENKQLVIEDFGNDDAVEHLDSFFTDFEENVKGEIVHESDFFTDEEAENIRFRFIDSKFTMESVYPKSLLKNTAVNIPEGFTHFMILPVDYNRGGDDIGVAFLTKKGKKNYSQYLTGDY